MSCIIPDTYPKVRYDDKQVFYPVSRTVYSYNGVRLSSCMFERCRFPFITCDRCHYGT